MFYGGISGFKARFDMKSLKKLFTNYKNPKVARENSEFEFSNWLVERLEGELESFNMPMVASPP